MAHQGPHQKGPIIDSISPAPNWPASNCLHGLTPYPKLHTKMSACCSARMLCLPARPRLFSALLHGEGLQPAVIPSFGRRARQPARHTSPVFALSLTQSPSPRTLPLFELSQRLLSYRSYRCCTLNPLPVCDRHVLLCGLNYCCRAGFGLFSECCRPSTTVTPALGKVPARCTYRRWPLPFRITIAASNASNASNAMTRYLAAQIVLIIQALDA